MNQIPSLDACEDFLRGTSQPVNSLDKALLAKLSASQLRERAKREMESIAAYQKSMDKLDADRKQIEKNAASRIAKPAPKPAAPAPAARPYAKDETDHLAACVRRGYGTAAELADMRAELETRGVSLNRIGYSIDRKNSH